MTQTDPNMLNHFTQQDREIMIRQSVNQERFWLDLRDLIKNVNERFQDHELRIRALEKTADDFSTVKKLVYWCVGLIIVIVFSALVSWTLK